MGRHRTCACLLLGISLLFCPLIALSLVPSVANARTNQHVLSAEASTASASLLSQDSDQSSQVLADLHLTPHLELDYTDRAAAKYTSLLLQSICGQDASDREVVQQCTVLGHGTLANWTDVTEALPCLPNLKDMNWHSIAPMPRMKEFLRTKLPDCRLHLDMTPSFDRYSREHVREEVFAALAGSYSMVSLKAHIEYNGDDWEPDRLPFVHQILATCPNIRSFDLNLGHSGCVVGGRQPRAFNFQNGRFADADLPPLQELKIAGYDFGGPLDGEDRWFIRHIFRPDRLPWPFSKLTPEQVEYYIPPPLNFWLEEVKEWLYSDDRPAWVLRNYERLTGDSFVPPTLPKCDSACCLTNETVSLDEWLKRMAFDSITTLELDDLDATVAPRLLPNLRSLTDLTIRRTEGCGHDALYEYLESPHNPLTSLSLVHISPPNDTLSSLLAILESKHHTLKHLTLPTTPEPLPEDLATLATGLPDLTTLTIQQPRALPLLGNYKPSAHFPSLESLTIHVPTPGEIHRARNDTLFNATNLERQFFALTEPTNKATTTTAHLPKLQRLEILIGAWDRRGEVSMIGPPMQVIGRYVCTRAEDTKGVAHENDGAVTMVECSGGLTHPAEYGATRLLVEGPNGDEVLFGEPWHEDDDGWYWDDDEDYKGVENQGWDSEERIAMNFIKAVEDGVPARKLLDDLR